MKITGQATIAAIEHAFAELSRGARNDPLTLPTRIKHLAGGGEASLAQLIVTWAQLSDPRILETFISSADSEQINDFTRRLTGLVAALCATKIRGREQSSDITAEVRASALDRLSALGGQRPGRAYRGPSAEIVCVDHIGRANPFLLYRPDLKGSSELRPREDFRALAAWLLQQTVPEIFHRTVDPEAGEAIGGMLYELFKNTEDHALANAQGDLLEISIRAIKTNLISIAPSELVRIVEEFPPLAAYCRSLNVREGETQTHLFEISILDSGPGFAATWTRKSLSDLSFLDEEIAVRECFGRGSAKGGSHFGQGLPHVLRLLEKEMGFLRLRTGRLCLFADYSQLADPAQTDRIRKFQPDLQELRRASGSLLTLMIPLRRPK